MSSLLHVDATSKESIYLIIHLSECAKRFNDGGIHFEQADLDALSRASKLFFEHFKPSFPEEVFIDDFEFDGSYEVVAKAEEEVLSRPDPWIDTLLDAMYACERLDRTIAREPIRAVTVLLDSISDFMADLLSFGASRYGAEWNDEKHLEWMSQMKAESPYGK